VGSVSYIKRVRNSKRDYSESLGFSGESNSGWRWNLSYFKGGAAVQDTKRGMCLTEKTMVLNDQGGSVMDISYEVTATLRAQDHGHPPLVYDARGNGDGIVCPTITGDHQNRITDYTAIVYETVQQSEE